MLYNIFTYIIVLISPLFLLGGRKLSLWYKGRIGLLRLVEQKLKGNKNRIIWFHCASLGEFEQGRQVIEEMRRRYTNYKIVLTFFSPSGYEQRKNYDMVDYVFYLPIDTPTAARRFVKAINPSIVVFVKYDYWANLLREAKRAGAKLYVISAIFNPNQYFFKWYGSSGRKMLRYFDTIFVQNSSSARLLNNIGIHNSIISGDTRFDRVHTLQQFSLKLDIVEGFVSKKNGVVLVAGSTWRPDEKVILEAMKEYPDVKFIIAPHEISESTVLKLKSECIALGRTVSLYTKDFNTAADVLIIDTIGVLSSAYKYGDIAYIGGGFGNGIHNTLEAATYGMPLTFGPNYERFAEAVDMVELGCATVINDGQDLTRWIGSVARNTIMRRKQSDTCKEYIENKRGATNIIIRRVAHQNGVIIEMEDDDDFNC